MKPKKKNKSGVSKKELARLASTAKPWAKRQLEAAGVLSDKQKAEGGIAKRKPKGKAARAGWSEKQYEVSYFLPKLSKRVTHRDRVTAENKQGAISQVRSFVRSRSLREMQGAVNFTAKRVNPKARAAAKAPRGPATAAKSPRGTTKNPRYSVEATPRIARQKFTVDAITHGSAVRKVKRKMGVNKRAFDYSVRKENPQQKFSRDTIKHLRREFAKIDGANMERHRADFDKVFAQMSRSQLAQIANSKIEWVSAAAKNAMVARRNPASKGKRKNLHPLELGSNAAAIVTALLAVRRDMQGSKKAAKRKKAPAKKKSNIGIGSLISVAEGIQAADYLKRRLKAKKKKRANSKQQTANSRKVRSVTRRTNPNNGSIHTRFTGKPSDKVTHGFYARQSEPKNVDELGDLTEIKLISANRGPILRFPYPSRRGGKLVLVFDRSLVDERGKEINPKRIHYLENWTKLCAKKLPNGRERFVVGQRQPYFLSHNGQANKRLNYGNVAQVTYRASKEHLYQNGDRPDKRIHNFFHNLGEEGGRQPRLVLENGWWVFEGGDYKIMREGIRN